MTKAVFAIPGNKDRRTGGFIYEARVLAELNAMGCTTRHLQLPDSFPDPTHEDMARTLTDLHAIPADQVIILDGLVFGAIDPAGLAQVPAPVIAMIHHPLGLETGLPADRAAHLLRNEAAALQHAAHTMVPSPETKAILCRDFGAVPDQISIAPPGFDRPIVDLRPTDPPLILSVGLLAPRKGHDVLLDALGGIFDLNWQAEIVGRTYDQTYAGRLLSQTRDLGLDKRVTFAGELDQRALTQRFNAACVFALATRYEGYGMVLSEAMFYGLPIVTCRSGAVPTTVGDAARLVDADDAGAFAQGLRDVLGNREEAARLSGLARARAETLPMWADTARAFADQVKALMHGGAVMPHSD
ncbi:MAG: glycosyltransferase family 4 protein [Pseudomonadota bacterium]